MYVTVIIRHLGNFDTCAASFKIQNGGCVIRVYLIDFAAVSQAKEKTSKRHS